MQDEPLPELIASDEMRALWPAFFSNQPILKKQAADALPAPDVPLDLFRTDIIEGKRKGTWAGRRDNLSDHFLMLMPEFVGRPRILHLLACTIVVIRKTKGSGPGLTLFHRIISEDSEHVFSNLNSRWLTSVADTLADHGQTPAQAALGVCGSLLANTVKLAETERLIFEIPRPWPPKARFEPGGKLYDGVIAFWTDKGDMIDNLLARISKTQELDDVGGLLVQEIMNRMLQNDTIYRRFAQISRTPHPPDVSDDVRARLKRIARKWL